MEKGEKGKKVFRSDRLLSMQKGRSQIDFATFLGIDQSQLQKYLNGSSDPSAANLAKIAKKLGVSSDWLIGLSDDQQFVVGDLTAFEKRVVKAFRDGKLQELFNLPPDLPESGASGGEPPVE